VRYSRYAGHETATISADHVNDMGDPSNPTLENSLPSGQMAADRLLPLVYDELKAVAERYMRGERSDHTLQPTALVHEAFLRLNQLENTQWASRSHFFGVAAHVMRRVLIDHARGHGAQKRGAQSLRLILEDSNHPLTNDPGVDLLDLDAALTRLAEIQPRHAQVVEMRFFGGLSVDETAALLGVSPSTIKSDWRMARAWLLVQLGKPTS
jgi:RNA polymerase sigma-70 factor, ECF subfamily